MRRAKPKKKAYLVKARGKSKSGITIGVDFVFAKNRKEALKKGRKAVVVSVKRYPREDE